MEPRLRRAARKLGRTVNAGVYLEKAALATAVIACATATAWVALKTLAPGIHLFALWGLAALPVAWIGAAVYCSRKGLFFDDYECLTLADKLALNDGALVAAAERPEFSRGSERALARLLESGHPMARLQPGVYARRLALPAVYFLAAALIPEGAVVAMPAATAVLDREIETLSNLVEEEELLDEARRAELQKQIEEIKAESREISQEQWEALEALRSKAAAAFEEQAQEAGDLQGEIDKFEEAARDALNKEDAQQAAEKMEKAAEKLAEAIKKSGLAGKDMNEALKKAKEEADRLKKECENCKNGGGDKKDGKGQGKPSPDGKALKKKLDDLKKKLEQRRSECDAKGGQCDKPGDKPGGASGQRPGKGGINRGRGDAPITFSDQPREIDAELQMKMLEMDYADEKDAIVVDINYRQPPKEGLEEAAAESVVRSGSVGVGGDASATFISPSQKDVVERYFQSR